MWRAGSTRRPATTGTRRVAYWRTLPTDADATFDAEITLDAAAGAPVRHLGHEPGPGHRRLDGVVPDPASFADDGSRGRAERALAYMACDPAPACGTSRSTSCSSARARTAGSKTCAPPPRCCGAGRSPTAYGCWSYRAPPRYAPQAEAEGLDKVFTDGRCRVALRRLLDVPRHEPGHALAGPARRRPRRTATSRAGRAAAGVPTWSRRRSPPRPPSPAASPPRPT